MTKVLVLNGPNLQRLGNREPEIYGSLTHDDLIAQLVSFGSELGLSVEVHQSDSEAELLKYIHSASDSNIAVVLNPAAFTHYSYALADACKAHTASGNILIEVHISNPHSRESFRSTSVISPTASGVIAGFGFDSYRLALQQISENR